ncbi:hypothetical protein SS50377_22764 [Spironucleus salmonicida]|nr:hypothetical protein SS50377_22764 [Spironucleus salmonicida]
MYLRPDRRQQGLVQNWRWPITWQPPWSVPVGIRPVGTGASGCTSGFSMKTLSGWWRDCGAPICGSGADAAGVLEGCRDLENSSASQLHALACTWVRSPWDLGGTDAPEFSLQAAAGAATFSRVSYPLARQRCLARRQFDVYDQQHQRYRLSKFAALASAETDLFSINALYFRQ